jgi:hypothetical protein
MADSIFDTLCGDSGIITRINEAQELYRTVVTGGKNDLFLIQQEIERIKSLTEPDVLKRKLQEDIRNLLSDEALRNPTGTIAQLLEIRAAYQELGPAIDRIIENVEQFIRDPLGTPLELCQDIPNIVRIGDEVRELADPSKTPDESPDTADPEPFDIKEALSKFETVPRFEKDKFFILNLPDDYQSPKQNARIGPGAANRAALGE